MYLAMDDLGCELYDEVLKFGTASDRWKKLSDIAKSTGFDGIQLNSDMYGEKFGLSLKVIPELLHKFRLTYHIGGVNYLATEEEYNVFYRNTAEAFDICADAGIEDVSFHPPLIRNSSDSECGCSKAFLSRLIEYWLPKFESKGLTLSLETHVTSRYFVFKGLEDYAQYVSAYSSLGVLIDISHNFYDGYSVDTILGIAKNLNVTGLHLSDADPGAEFRAGTHLPVGKGKVDFGKIIGQFKDCPNVYGALEIKGSAVDITSSVSKLKSMLRQSEVSE